MPTPTPTTPVDDSVDAPADAVTTGPTGPAGPGDDVDHGGPGGPADPARPVDPADTAWFEAVVREHTTAVHRFLVRRAGRQDAEDLTADVLTVAWRRRDDVPRGAELPWLYRTAGYVLANHVRKARPVPVADVPEGLDPTDPAVLAVRDEQVRAVLAALGVRDRQILLLNAWEGLAGQALADVLGISRGGADAALSRARARLREAWDGQDADTPTAATDA
ncbi:RNA polymerase sigma factor [Cellulomonas biazotea]|uniref:RNA polymerase sigma factor n=1 Tax=Cellulomonas biazotea TaxID=1709 RepID=UPI00103267D2|nr:sigma-70 family RNA polymerase sigma factor [Cellulomonas biazotea]